ncbi:hypothetical protein AV530_007780 [Patagioenas fasciata monilis]|uniref:Uncharacterized protein n=1 Tax=Patagioenas fasciata monilis TaxID=372326 RepID=A0A1V4JSW7_PATFA|nr:hypothetical protein AV530_007780 [Patagioenas fasciata monilis]
MTLRRNSSSGQENKPFLGVTEKILMPFTSTATFSAQEEITCHRKVNLQLKIELKRAMKSKHVNTII